MTFEEFEEADGRSLRTHAKECFEYVKDGTIMADDLGLTHTRPTASPTNKTTLGGAPV
jgi:hypothetical protein